MFIFCQLVIKNKNFFFLYLHHPSLLFFPSLLFVRACLESCALEQMLILDNFYFIPKFGGCRKEKCCTDWWLCVVSYIHFYLITTTHLPLALLTRCGLPNQFFSDYFTHLNSLNTSMQGRNKVLLDIVEEIEAFKGKMKLWITKMEKKKNCCFSRLKLVSQEKKKTWKRVVCWRCFKNI